MSSREALPYRIFRRGIDIRTFSPPAPSVDKFITGVTVVHNRPYIDTAPNQPIQLPDVTLEYQQGSVLVPEEVHVLKRFKLTTVGNHLIIDNKMAGKPARNHVLGLAEDIG